MTITNWKNLPAIDVVTKTLVYNTPCDETFEKRLSSASEKLCYTKSEIVAIRNRRDAFIKAYGRTQGFHYETYIFRIVSATSPRGDRDLVVYVYHNTRRNYYTRMVTIGGFGLPIFLLRDTSCL